MGFSQDTLLRYYDWGAFRLLLLCMYRTVDVVLMVMMVVVLIVLIQSFLRFLQRLPSLELLGSDVGFLQLQLQTLL